VLGASFLSLRIYDIIIVELVPDGYDADSETFEGSREWAGIWKAIVLGVDPDISNEKNTVRLALIGKENL